jgi:hypothetical protein
MFLRRTRWGATTGNVSFTKKRSGNSTVLIVVSAEQCTPECNWTIAALKKNKEDQFNFVANEELRKNPQMLWDISEVNIAGEPRVSVYHRSYLRTDSYSAGMQFWLNDGVNLIGMHVMSAEGFDEPTIGFESDLTFEQALPKSEMVAHAAAVLAALQPSFGAGS